MIDRSRTAKTKSHSIDTKLLQRKLSFADNLVVKGNHVDPPVSESSSLAGGLMTPDVSTKWNTDTPPHGERMIIDYNSPMLTQAVNQPANREGASDAKCVSPVTPISTPLARHSACPSFFSIYDIRQVPLPATPQKPLHRRNSYSFGGKHLSQKASMSSKISDRSMIKHKLKRIKEADRGKSVFPPLGQSTINECSEDFIMQPAALSQSYINTPAGSQPYFNTQNDGLSQSYSQFTQPLTFPQHGYHADFHETSLLGSGHFGKVYAVERRLDGLKFAVKQIPEVGGYTSCRARKLQEICTMGMASSGLHIVQLHHAWAEGDNHQQKIFIMMELCTGGSLQSRFDHVTSSSKKKPFESSEQDLCSQADEELKVVDILGQLALALYSCHSRNIAHCDLKLENVLYDSNHRLKLADFGLAVFLDPVTRQPAPFYQQSCDVSPPAEILPSFAQDDGDARYISLDMLNERNHFTEGDIFSLGMCMYEIMSGESLPKNGQEYIDLRTTDLVSRRLRAKGSFRDPLVNIVYQMVAVDPATRPGITEILFSRIFHDIKAEIQHSKCASTHDQISFLKTVSEIEFVSYDIAET